MVVPKTEVLEIQSAGAGSIPGPSPRYFVSLTCIPFEILFFFLIPL